MEEGKKFDVEFKQTAKGFWYVGSLKTGADNIEELDKFLDSTIKFLHTKVDKLNKGDIKPAVSSEIVLNDAERRLFDKLRNMRMELSREENIPPYMVAHDSVLKKLASLKPMTREDMLNIGGFGEKSFDKYGVYFLKVIRSNV